MVRRSKTKILCASKKVCTPNIEQRATRSKTNSLSAIEDIFVSNLCSFSNIGERVTRSKTKNLSKIEEISVSSFCSSSRVEQRATRSKTKKENAIEETFKFNSWAISDIEQTKVKSKKVESTGLNASKNCLATFKRFVKLANYEKDSIVLAKQKHSIPWPARILEVGKKKISVYFLVINVKDQ